jgi:hypothetical protein
LSYAGAWDRVEGGPGAALLLAIAGPALLIAVGIVLLIYQENPSSFDLADQAVVFVVALLAALPVIAIAVFLIGLPLTWLLARWRLERIWVYPAAGFVAGAALIILVPYLIEGSRGGGELDFVSLAWGLIGAVPGALSGAIWWWAHRRYEQAREAERG